MVIETSVRHGRRIPRWADDASSRENNFDVIRFLMASAVVVSHSFSLLAGDDSTDPAFIFTRGQLSLGALAVDVFFVISGYLIAQSWLKSRRAGSFFAKRIARIYPGFLVASLICLLVVGPFAVARPAEIFNASRIASTTVHALLLDYIQVPNTFPANPVHGLDGSMWTIRYEFLCYVALAIIGTIGLLRRRYVLAGFFALLVIGYTVAERTGWHPETRPKIAFVIGQIVYWPRLITFFLAGTAFFCFRSSIPRSHVLAIVCTALLLTVGAKWGWLALLLPTAGAYVVMYVAFADHGPYRFARYGDFSYGIYLYSFPIQQLWVQRLGTTANPWLIFALSLPPSIVAGIASWYLVERRFLRKAHSAERIPTLASATST